MRDWLTVIIVLLIVGIVLDAVRRMRQARREHLQLSKNAIKADQEAVGARSSDSEFPSGGPRVVGVRDENHAKKVTQSLRENFESSKTTRGAPQRIPEQVTLNLEEAVPMLMESVEEELEDETPIEEEIEQHIEPSLGELDELQDDIPEDSGVPVKAEPKAQALASEDLDEPAPAEPDEVIVFNIMAKSGTRFSGADLLNTLMTENMKFGSMDIFHRHAQPNGDGPVLFSLVNMVVPGTFNLAAMKDFETPGVSLFMSLPIEGAKDGDSIDAYELLVDTARNLARSLGGELKDESRSVMTQQTMEHGRQRVMEYERKRRLAAAH
ncbi:cell division protein ZipA [Teredinibacter sp. KSP-S5-2]|uniref:cell division protein ZipA n=1 Tax=Teredinibacter sp. KSP-S5-2 TaxID=3034506 RepID=UPI002934B8ED|nr:cell division protein ZipA [Teredinibacter sp. KSP-S5-2]WNO07686.1 cell division protein ZipA [Teredinibacter sp. KSP-S5-2]